MQRTEVVVEIYDTQTGQAAKRTFSSSPVRIGSTSWSGLRLDDPDVAPVHGDIWFGDTFVAFGNLASKKRTWLDGQLVQPGVLEILREGSILTVGPYRLEISRRERNQAADPLFDWSPANDEPTLPDLAFESFPVSSVEFVTRAVAVVAEFSSVLPVIRKHLALPAQSEFSGITNPDELVDYLLDPRSPHARLKELRGELRALVAWTKQILRPNLLGSA